MTDRAEAIRDLVLAIFRLAVCDYLKLSYGHDSPDRVRHCRANWNAADAGFFLSSAWAAQLADLAGFRSQAVWEEARARKMAITEATACTVLAEEIAA